jgi:ribosomal protein S18 acetylase RimI-like enzyme
MLRFDVRAVAEPARRLGVATALIAELGRVAAQRGVSVVFVQADHGDDAAIALYDKVGTRAEVLHFDIEPAGARHSAGHSAPQGTPPTNGNGSGGAGFV